MKEKIVAIISKEVHLLNNIHDNKIPIEQGEDCHLYGINGVMNSLSLVSLIVAVEEGIEAEFNRSVILANEKAMSQRNSPFASVRSLADYIVSILATEETSHV
jgi:hypothetical protein